MQQLLSYLRTYTSGELYNRVTKTGRDKSLELLRELIYRGKNQNKNRLINLKAQALNPPRAVKVSDLDRVLTEWEHTIDTIKQSEGGYKLEHDTRMTILLKIMPKEYIKDLRDIYNKGEIKNYYDFEQALQDEIANRRMDEEMAKGGTINELRDNEPMPESPELPEEQYVETHVWIEDLNCWVCGLAEKRPAQDDAGDGGRDDKKQRTDSKGHGGNTGPYQKGGKDGKGGPTRTRPVGPCWSCGGPHLQRDCPHQSGKGGKGTAPIPSAWASWRPGTFPGPTQQQWRSWLPRQGKGGKGGQSGFGNGGKGSGKKGGKLGDLQGPMWGPPLGQVQWQQQAWSPAIGQVQWPNHWQQEQWQPPPNGLVPICGAVTLGEPDPEWSEARKTFKQPSNYCPKKDMNIANGNSFAELSCDV